MENKTQSAAKQVADKLLAMAVMQKLHTGDKLPGEIELAAQFQVSRITIREAINGLKFLGILESAPRRGTTIANLDYNNLTKYIGFQMAFEAMGQRELLEARISIEVGAMSLATEKLTPQSYQELLSLAQAYADCISDQVVDRGIRHADLNFHRKLLEIAGNPILLAFGNLIETFFMINQVNHDGQRDDPEVNRQAAHMHLLIARALRERNIDLARGLIRSHLLRHIEE